MPQTVGIEISNLQKSFAQRKVIEDLSLSLSPGSFTAVVGPSGCGKSTLLRLIGGLETVTSGALHNQLGHSLGFVFQEANLLPWRTVLENVLLPFEISGSFKNISPEVAQSKALVALEKVQLKGESTLFPHQLSGGMKMRVAIARALVTDPKLLLLDEPFAALDEFTRAEMQLQLYHLWHQERMTVVFVTHSLSEAVFLAERVVMLKGPGAKIVADEKIPFPKERTESLKTSAAFNTILQSLTERLRS